MDAMGSALAGGLAVAIPNAFIACVVGLVKSPLKIVMLMLAKLVLYGLCLAFAIKWYVTAPVPFFVAAAVVMVLPGLTALIAQTSEKAQIKGLR